jgi:eukaryotic-like serine/threonine-protein kinase
MQKDFERGTAIGGLDAGTLLYLEAYTQTYHGRLKNARQFWQRAATSVSPAELPETVASWRVREAFLEAEVGQSIRARRLASEALEISRGRDVEVMAALTMARAGDTAGAQKLSDKLSRDFPRDTLIRFYGLPAIRAAIELRQKRPSEAVQALHAATPYEFSLTGLIPNMFSPYLRGEAYLQSGLGKQAAMEFQKILDHPGLVENAVTGSLARLQLGRAQAMMGDKAAARVSYQNFLSLWKDADPDVPIYRQAKTEYAKMR